ncbi:CinA family protein [Tomitella biformata]|uniref:CinA family protein n=1 Tax=Tomitella biformata TaxID=630403 RepID=UPI00046631E3|nr:nicotinamide-nucleotide amidohydrolase family protein [Tomitella biformata]
MSADPLVAGTCAAELVAELAARGQSLATAESLTGGLVAATVAGVPGASAVLRGGVIVYATELKHTLAGVPADVLAADGPVAATTAQFLAAGAAERCGATWGVGLTGVAGPDRQDGKAVGTVFVGFAGIGPTGDRVAWTTELRLDGSRWEIRSGAVVAALRDLLEAVRRQC